MKTLVVLLGPTGVGKTEISLQIAAHFQTSILNCDSRQLFGDMQIGTAAPTPEQLAQVHHHFVGILPLTAYYSAAQYEKDVLVKLNELYQNTDIVLMTGGSMLYIDAVCKGIDEIPTIDKETRTRIKERLECEGLEKLYKQLKKLDPEYAAIVDPKNTQRVVHALEICTMTGKPYSSFRLNSKKERPFRIIKIGLNRPREELFQRINQRVYDMMKAGLMEEVKRLQPFRHQNALNTVGYKELFNVIDGTWELDMAVERIKKNTRVYAKKQLTWFMKDSEIQWFHPSEVNNIIQYIKSYEEHSV